VQWKAVIARLRAAGVPQVTFPGGEPTLRPALFELIDYSKWFITRLNTNGILLTPDFCEKLRKASLDSIQITFYSSDEAIHNRLVGAPRFADTAAGGENALAAGLSVSGNTALCTLRRDYVSTLEYLHEKGVIYVTCSGLITTGNAAKEPSERLQLSNEEIRDILAEAVHYCYSNGMEISFTSPGWVAADFCETLGISTPTCGACLSNMAVTPGGGVVPCQSWLSGEALGNILEESWENIWNGEACARIREQSALMSGECPLRIRRTPDNAASEGKEAAE
jgi:MoaA/NifB/PqqE/SkfB family radical SAM enzyme